MDIYPFYYYNKYKYIAEIDGFCLSYVNVKKDYNSELINFGNLFRERFLQRLYIKGLWDYCNFYIMLDFKGVKNINKSFIFDAFGYFLKYYSQDINDVFHMIRIVNADNYISEKIHGDLLIFYIQNIYNKSKNNDYKVKRKRCLSPFRKRISKKRITHD